MIHNYRDNMLAKIKNPVVGGVLEIDPEKAVKMEASGYGEIDHVVIIDEAQRMWTHKRLADYLKRGGTYGNKLSHQNFAELFGRDENIPIVANFHGYPETLKTILGNYTNSFRVRAHGFVDEGTTTTPFEMLSLNHASRYDLALEVAKDLNRTDLIEKYQGILMANYIHANKYGDDLAELVV